MYLYISGPSEFRRARKVAKGGGGLMIEGRRKIIGKEGPREIFGGQNLVGTAAHCPPAPRERFRQLPMNTSRTSWNAKFAQRYTILAQ